MRYLLPILFAIGCASPPSKKTKQKPAFHPVVYVMLDCGDPTHDHTKPADITLSNDWPPLICIGEER